MAHTEKANMPATPNPSIGVCRSETLAATRATEMAMPSHTPTFALSPLATTAPVNPASGPRVSETRRGSARPIHPNAVQASPINGVAEPDGHRRAVEGAGGEDHETRDHRELLKRAPTQEIERDGRHGDPDPDPEHDASIGRVEAVEGKLPTEPAGQAGSEQPEHACQPGNGCILRAAKRPAGCHHHERSRARKEDAKARGSIVPRPTDEDGCCGRRKGRTEVAEGLGDQRDGSPGSLTVLEGPDRVRLRLRDQRGPNPLVEVTRKTVPRLHGAMVVPRGAPNQA